MMKVTEVFAFVALDQEGNESMVGVQPSPEAPFMIPLVAKNQAEADQFKPFAQKISDALKKPVTLVKFTAREDLETISS